MIQFLLNGQQVEINNINPNTTLLLFLRQNASLKGTKEGCSSGDCGACTVLVGSKQGEHWEYKAINSCLALLASMHGKQVITVEALASDSELHPVQQAMVDNNGSQCGFCTPGFIMSLAGLYDQATNPSRDQIVESISGNLCRCTGYSPIVKAAALASSYKTSQTLSRVNHWQPDDMSIPGIENSSKDCVFTPQSEQQLKALLQQYPNANLVAGGTDINLSITQLYESLGNIIITTQVQELSTIELCDDGGIAIGAAVSYEQAAHSIVQHYPEAKQLLSRIGSLQIRQAATLAGNIANASPIGDGPPLLIALAAKVEVASDKTFVEHKLEDFIRGYKTTILKPGEYIRRIIIPPRPVAANYQFLKVSKRFEDDISTVLLAAFYSEKDGLINDCRFAFGGMAATPKRASSLEQMLLNKSPNTLNIDELAALIDKDFEPMSDVRASANYRLEVARNLVKKVLLAISGETQLLSIWTNRE